MKSIKKLLIFAIFLVLSHSLFAQTSLCNSVYNFLKSSKCNPKTQSLVSSSINYFPYNISAEFPAKNTSSNDYFLINKNLYLIFNQEEVISNKQSFLNLFEYLKNNEFDFNIRLIFTYGENQLLEKDGNIYGIDTFLETVNTNEDSTAILINLDRQKNSIQSTSSGFTAPSWLIKNEHDIFKKEKISPGLPIYYISQMYNYKFNVVRQLDRLFSAGIPSVILNFSSELTNTDVLTNIIIDSITSYANTSDKIWDQHFLMVSLLGHYFRLSETFIVHIIVFIILAFLLFIFLVRLINKSFQYSAWMKIKKIWYVVPITLALVFVSLLAGKGLYLLFGKRFSDVGKLYFTASAGLIITFILTTAYYWLQIVFNSKFEAHSIDFMITITIFINQFVFSLIDISLFPLFMFACLLSILATFIKNNIFHIIILCLIIIPFCCYANALVKTSNSALLFEYTFSNLLTLFFVSLVVYPTFLMYFRILSAFKETFNRKLPLFITGGITSGLAIIIISTIGFTRTNQIKNKTRPITQTSIIRETEDVIHISWSDKKIFGDTVRKLQITFDKPCYQCDVQVTSKTGTPILYSSDDYDLLESSIAYFKIPYNPPENLIFNYGTEELESTIKVTAFFQTNDKDKFSLTSKSITIN